MKLPYWAGTSSSRWRRKQTSRIPTLDIEIWLERTKERKGPIKLLYSFFEKPMSSKYTVLETRAWSFNSKSCSMAQEVRRRMLNTSEDIKK